MKTLIQKYLMVYKKTIKQTFFSLSRNINSSSTSTPQISNKTIGQDEKRRLNFPRFLISIRVETVRASESRSIDCQISIEPLQGNTRNPLKM